LSAAKFGIEYSLPLADSVVFATARHHGAQVWTQDSDFEGLPDVHFTPKQ
jgi:predicted nucleic acid-binding protein